VFVATFERLSRLAHRVPDERVVTSKPSPAARHNRPVQYQEEQVVEHCDELPASRRSRIIGWPLLSGRVRSATSRIDAAPPGDVFADLVTVSPAGRTVRSALDGAEFRESDTYRVLRS